LRCADAQAPKGGGLSAPRTPRGYFYQKEEVGQAGSGVISVGQPGLQIAHAVLLSLAALGVGLQVRVTGEMPGFQGFRERHGGPGARRLARF